MGYKKIKTPLLRKPYYEMSDQVYRLKEITENEIVDQTLKEKVDAIFNAQNELHTYMESKYIWD